MAANDLMAGGGVPAPLPGGGIQGSSQSRVPYQGQYNGNPRGANNMQQQRGAPQVQGPVFNMTNPNSNMGNMTGFNPTPNNMAYMGGQAPTLGRYAPPMMEGGRGGSGYNSGQWGNQGGYQYNIPESYGQTGLNYNQGQPQGGFGNQGGRGGMGGSFQDMIRQMMSQMQERQGGGMPGLQPGKDGTPLRQDQGPAPTFQGPEYAKPAFEDQATQKAPTPSDRMAPMPQYRTTPYAANEQSDYRAAILRQLGY